MTEVYDKQQDLLWSIFSSGPVLESVGAHLDIGEIVNLSRTCKDLSGLYNEFFCLHWDVDWLLKRFFAKPKQFRLQMGLSEALICGSFALEFFERPLWQAPNLDLVVKDGQSIFDMMTYLAEKEGYEVFAESKGDERDAIAGMPHGFRHVEKASSIFILRRESDLDPELPKTIHLYMTSLHSFPVQSIVDGAWTTSLINFISWRMAYSIFPHATFIDRKAYLVENLGRNRELPLQKFRDRHYKFEIMNEGLQVRRNHPMQKCRKAIDKFSWRIPLDTFNLHLHPDLDPVPEDDVVYITERKNEIEKESLRHFGFQDLGDGGSSEKPEGADVMITRHYETKYMRYSGFFT